MEGWSQKLLLSFGGASQKQPKEALGTFPLQEFLVNTGGAARYRKRSSRGPRLHCRVGDLARFLIVALQYRQWRHLGDPTKARKEEGGKHGRRGVLREYDFLLLCEALST